MHCTTNHLISKGIFEAFIYATCNHPDQTAKLYTLIKDFCNLCSLIYLQSNNKGPGQTVLVDLQAFHPSPSPSLLRQLFPMALRKLIHFHGRKLYQNCFPSLLYKSSTLKGQWTVFSEEACSVGKKIKQEVTNIVSLGRYFMLSLAVKSK